MTVKTILNNSFIHSILYFHLILYRYGMSHNFSIQERVQSICQDTIYLNNIEYN